MSERFAERDRIRLKFGAGFCACKGDEIGMCDLHAATDITGRIKQLIPLLDRWGKVKEQS